MPTQLGFMVLDLLLRLLRLLRHQRGGFLGLWSYSARQEIDSGDSFNNLLIGRYVHLCAGRERDSACSISTPRWPGYLRFCCPLCLLSAGTRM